MREIIFLVFTSTIAFGANWQGVLQNQTLNSGDNTTILIDDHPGNNSSSYWQVTANNGFVYSTNGDSASYLTLRQSDLSKKVEFYDCYQSTCRDIYINNNSHLTIDFKDSSHYNGSKIIISQNASYTENGARFRTDSSVSGSYGYILNKGTATLNFSDYILFSNGLSLINDGGTININTPNLYNGVNGRYYGVFGIMNLINNSTTTINGDVSSISGNLTSFGINGSRTSHNTDKQSEINLDSSTLTINGALKNGGTSQEGRLDVFVYGTGIVNLNNGILNATSLSSTGVEGGGRVFYSYVNVENNSSLRISNNFENKQYSNILVDSSIIDVGGKFSSGANTTITFGGTGASYGKIKANEIDINGANVNIQLRANGITSGQYTIFEATTSLLHSLTLGNQNIYSNDGSINIFYSANLSSSGNSIKLDINEQQIDNVGDKVGLNGNAQTIINSLYNTNDANATSALKSLGVGEINSLGNNIDKLISSFVNKTSRAYDVGKNSIQNRMLKRISGIASNSGADYVRLASNEYHHKYAVSSTDFADSIVVDSTSKDKYIASNRAIYPRSIGSTKSKSTNSISSSLYAGILGGYLSNDLAKGFNYGFNVGYDLYISDVLVGIYGSYIMENLKDSALLGIKSDTIQFGGYLRYTNPNFEIDILANYNMYNNKLNHSLMLGNSRFDTSASYKNNAINAYLTAGPLINFGSNSFKFFVGVDYTYNLNNDIIQKGFLQSTYSMNNTMYLDGIIGIEYRSYFSSDDGYLFIRPEVQIPIFSNAKDVDIVFLTTPLTYKVYNDEIFGSIMLGGEGKINDFSFIALSGVFKASNKKSIIANGMANIRFIF